MSYDARQRIVDSSDGNVAPATPNSYDLLEYLYEKLPKAYGEQIPGLNTFHEMTQSCMGIPGNSGSNHSLVLARNLKGLVQASFADLLRKSPVEILKRCTGDQGCGCQASVVSVPYEDSRITIHFVVPQKLSNPPSPGLAHTTVKGLLDSKVLEVRP